MQEDSKDEMLVKEVDEKGLSPGKDPGEKLR